MSSENVGMFRTYRQLIGLCGLLVGSFSATICLLAMAFGLIVETGKIWCTIGGIVVAIIAYWPRNTKE